METRNCKIKKNISISSYKFNGKELDAETGLYYYGARYYDPSAALWLGVDPLAEKYPGVSPYVYCAGNPVKYVDPDGNAPWDNHYIQVAQSEASSTGEKYSQWTGQNGCVYASVQTTSVVSDGCGGIALEVAGTTAAGAAVTVAGILNSADDIGTNAKGESFLQQQVITTEGKQTIGNIKTAISVANILYSGENLLTKPEVNTLEETVNIVNTSTGIYNSLNKSSNEQ